MGPNCPGPNYPLFQGRQLSPGQLGPVAETLQLKCIPQMLAVFIQYEYIYQQIYVTKTCARRAYRHPSMFKTPKMLAVDIQYKYILQNVHSPTQRVHRNPPTGIYISQLLAGYMQYQQYMYFLIFTIYIFVFDLRNTCQLNSYFGIGYVLRNAHF